MKWTRVYRLPSTGLGGWAVFFLTEDGFLSCVTDYGNYGYHWTNRGPRDFRKFLTEIDPDSYLAGKLCPGLLRRSKRGHDNSDIHGFLAAVWPRFVAVLKQELASEKHAVSW